eukprot:360180-Chlamydomonas_euryale.AAC.1
MRAFARRARTSGKHGGAVSQTKQGMWGIPHAWQVGRKTYTKHTGQASAAVSNPTTEWTGTCCFGAVHTPCTCTPYIRHAYVRSACATKAPRRVWGVHRVKGMRARVRIPGAPARGSIHRRPRSHHRAPLSHARPLRHLRAHAGHARGAGWTRAGPGPHGIVAGVAARRSRGKAWRGRRSRGKARP